jgi:ribonuclease BN (tRNA processing enzyme)
MPINTAEVIEKKIAIARTEYFALWSRIIEEWRTSQTGDITWLTYAANYLFCTGGVRWALDPYSLSTRVNGVVQPHFAEDLDKLELVMLSHAHNDHIDINLINALAHLPIFWIIPGHMLEMISTKTTLRREQIAVPVSGSPIEFHNLQITPFDGLHFLNHGGIPETGYLFEFNHKKWLFPGDIRNFDNDKLPEFNNLNGVFAHLWLGKAKALESNPPLLEEFCTFFCNLSPARLVISHLNEFGRDPSELWNEYHYELVRQKMSYLCPNVIPEMAIMGKSVKL